MSEDLPSRIEGGMRHLWRRSRASRPRGEGGFVLVLVLGILVFFAVVSIALLQMTQTTSTVARKLPNAMKLVREADGALDTAVNKIRSERGACGATTAVAGFRVECVTSTSTSASRDLTISVFKPATATKAVGQVRIVIEDQLLVPGLDPVDAVGNSLTVCDWQVGDVVSATVNTCSVVP